MFFSYGFFSEWETNITQLSKLRTIVTKATLVALHISLPMYINVGNTDIYTFILIWPVTPNSILRLHDIKGK